MHIYIKLKIYCLLTFKNLIVISPDVVITAKEGIIRQLKLLYTRSVSTPVPVVILTFPLPLGS